MDYKEITDLIKMVNKSNLTEFKMRNGDFEITIRTENYHKAKSNNDAPPAIVPVQASAPVQHIITTPSTPNVITESKAPVVVENKEVPAAAGKSEAKESAETEYIEVRSPIVGTFYRSASPEKPPYIKVCLLYTSPSPRDATLSRMPSSA